MPLELPDIVAAQKTISTPGIWVERDIHRSPAWLTYTAPLEMDGVTIAGLRLRATAIKNRPESCVTFQLEYQRPKFPGSALCRVEWRPAGVLITIGESGHQSIATNS